MVTRQRYNKIRRYIRDNGNYALKWFYGEELELAQRMVIMQQHTDRLAERAENLRWCLSINTNRRPSIKDLKFLAANHFIN